MARPVVHWEIGARDAATLRRFYAALFDWEITGDSDYGLVSPIDEGIGGGILQTRQGMPSYVTFYVGVDDLETSLERATSLGGRTLVRPIPIPGVGAFAMFSDPEGNTIGLMNEATDQPGE
jgi:predicted enzyme related to lactoylglutathione lyase